ncbi:MAG: dienelactone hydrolase family protein [Alphaproteobacteria bacterium]|nr:dienelactone hydrolase family protein [Alphaproteobacteria bacterium]MCR4555268.1 dienelactone hydrolase family protein [Alphaproteobacteria bacterium]
MDELIIPSKNETKNLIFLFHGYGSNKENLQIVGENFAKELPAAEIHLPNGIEFCPETYDGYKWFSMNSDTLSDWEFEFKKNVPQIMEYVDSIKNSKNLEYSDVIFSGFSQGAMLSLSLGIHYNVKAVIAFSGLILSPDKFLKNAETKVLLAHGSNDSVVPVSAVDFTKSALEKFNISTKVAIAPGLDHAINGYLLDQAVDFLHNL